MSKCHNQHGAAGETGSKLACTSSTGGCCATCAGLPQSPPAAVLLRPRSELLSCPAATASPMLCAGFRVSSGCTNLGCTLRFNPAELPAGSVSYQLSQAGTKSVNSVRRSPPFPVQLLIFLLESEPKLSAAPMAELHTALLAQLLVGQLSLFLAWVWGAQVGWSFEVKQPDKWMWVTVGQTLTLNCTVTASGPIGPVKWVKGWGSSSQTVYDRKSSSRRVTRALNESNTDFTIHIVDIHPEDAGTYYCVKFEKKIVDNEMLSRGQGTKVSVYETSPFPSIEVAAAVLCFILLIFILAFCLYRRKQRGGEQSQHVAEVTTGSCSPFPVPCCAGSPGTPSSEVQDAENPKLMHQQSSEVDKDIHYADLQPLPAARWPSRRHGTEHSEYASIRAAAK
ncbi:uncharacterized protein LOC107323148 isoform X1 [Coturnix japonica]|uniref:uncharacterized protein LOC107323148 isoform X1 n=1 Tax=Coturnix japonica TaxID=93934 RepID=UPI0013A5DA7C|nr:uncharacterized protein LOC107323148 isoform X1 [Coturnix japonica]